MKFLQAIFGRDLRQFGMLFALVALVVFFQIRTDGLVLTSANVMNLLNGNAYILVLAIGMVLVIIAGHIDLSVGSVAAFAGIVTALAIRDGGAPPWLAVLVCLAIGTVIGAWQGLWVAYFGIPGFVVTLAGMMLFRGANQLVGQSNTIPVPEAIQFLGGGYLPNVGPATGYNNPTLLLGALGIAGLLVGAVRARLAARRLGGEVVTLPVLVVRLGLLTGVIGYLTYLFASGRPGTSFPVPGLILLSLVILYSFITRRTIFGRHVYAVGGNRQAAELSGVNTRRVNFFVMLNMSLLAALAGLMFIGRATASGPFDGMNWELDAISAVFIGGAAVSGGVGTVVGSVIGGLVMAVLNNGLQLMGVGADMTQIIKGLVLLLAVGFDVYNKTRGRPSIVGLLFRNRPTDAAAAGGGATGVGAAGAGARGAGTTRQLRPAAVGVIATVVIAVGAAMVLMPRGDGGSQRVKGQPGSDAAGGKSPALPAGARIVGAAGGSSGVAAESFPKGSLIGVALPQKTSENWVLAQKLFRDGLTASGYQADVQFANGGVPEQQNQIQTMITRGARVIIVGAIDGSQLGSQLKEARDAGAVIIAYDRLLTNTSAVDYYLAYDNFKVGVLQARALLDGLAKRKGKGPWNIELIAGSPDDANSQVFFNGAMSVLQPKIDDGTLVVRSGQLSFAQASTQGWKAENAQRRMDTILAGTYARHRLDGILSPNDTLGRAALTAARAAGKELPVVTGQDSEVESVKSIMRGEQYSTINKDTTALVRHAITMVDDLQQGKAPAVNDDKTYQNGVKVVPAYLLEPQIVTSENAAESYANDPVLKDVVRR